MDEWKQYRSLFLYFLVQTERYSKAVLKNMPNASELPELDAMLQKGDMYLDQLVEADRQMNNVVVLAMPAGQVLFFPEIGYFQFPVFDPGCVTNFTFGIGVPITPQIAVTKIRKTADFDKLKTERGQLSGYSIGLNETMCRIVIPKIVRDKMADEDIRSLMEQQRKAAIEVVTATHQARKLVADLYGKFGIEVGPK